MSRSVGVNLISNTTATIKISLHILVKALEIPYHAPVVVDAEVSSAVVLGGMLSPIVVVRGMSRACFSETRLEVMSFTESTAKWSLSWRFSASTGSSGAAV